LGKDKDNKVESIDSNPNLEKLISMRLRLI
jgi:hypothetical protein